MGRNDGRYIQARPFDLVRAMLDLQKRVKTLETSNLPLSTVSMPDANSVLNTVAATTPAGDPASGHLVYTQTIAPINVDGDFESINALNGITTWGGQNGATVEVSGGNAVLHNVGSGAGSLNIVPDGITANPIGASELCTVVPSSQYTLSIWTYSDQGWGTVQVGIAYYDVNEAYISTTLSSSYSIGAGTGSLQTLTDTTPANAAYAQIVAQMTGTPASTTILGVDTAWLLPGTVPASQTLASSITANQGFDQYGNEFQEGATLNIANISGAITLSTGVAGGSTLGISPDVAMPFVITSLISGVIEAAATFTTGDPNEIMAGITGVLQLGTGAAAKQAGIITSPFTGQGAAVAVLSQNDGGTDVSSIQIGVVTTPDNETIVFSPVMGIYPYALLMYGGTSGQTVVTKSSGSSTIPIPAGVTTIKAECWGGGGGGHCGIIFPTNGNGGEYGGAGGEYACENALPVTPSSNINYSVGAGSAGTAPGMGTPGNGGNTTINNNLGTGGGAGNGIVTAHGATITSNLPIGGTGSGNSIHFNGGNGGTNPNADDPPPDRDNGGAGGGSSAGTGHAGNNGPNTSGNAGRNGATAPTGGGNGGKGGGTGSGGSNGANGQSPGGGGGGGWANTGGASSGGNGANGFVRVTYTVGGGLVIGGSISATAGTDLYGNPYPAGTQLPGPGDGNLYNCGPLIKTKSTNQTITSTSAQTVTWDTGPSAVPVAASTTYRLHAIIRGQQGTTGGVTNNFQFQVTGTPTNSAYKVNFLQYTGSGGLDNTNYLGVNTNILSPTYGANQGYWLEIDGYFTTGSAGTLTLFAAEGTAGDTFMILNGTFMEITPAIN